MIAATVTIAGTAVLVVHVYRTEIVDLFSAQVAISAYELATRMTVILFITDPGGGDGELCGRVEYLAPVGELADSQELPWTLMAIRPPPAST